MKKNTVNKPAFKIALCAAVAALEIILIVIAGFTRAGTYACPSFAGMLTVAIVIEYRFKWALGVYFTAAVLSFFLTGDKEAALLFVLFFGYYPIVKNVLESRVKNVVLRWVIKFALFNAAVIGSFFAAMYLLGVPAAEYELFGVYVPYVFLLIANIFFPIYDLAVNVFVRYYVQRLRKAVFGRNP